MQFLTILAALTSAAFAADICRATTNDCSGTVVCCSDIQENRCCNLASTSRILWKLPANRRVHLVTPLIFPQLTNYRSRAQGFSNNGCSAGTVTTQNPNAARSICVTYGSNRLSGRWLTGLSSRIKREAEVEACAEPNVVLRVRDGVTTKVELKDGLTVEEALTMDGDEVVDGAKEYESVAE